MNKLLELLYKAAKQNSMDQIRLSEDGKNQAILPVREKNAIVYLGISNFHPGGEDAEMWLTFKMYSPIVVAFYAEEKLFIVNELFFDCAECLVQKDWPKDMVCFSDALVKMNQKIEADFNAYVESIDAEEKVKEFLQNEEYLTKFRRVAREKLVYGTPCYLPAPMLEPNELMLILSGHSSLEEYEKRFKEDETMKDKKAGLILISRFMEEEETLSAEERKLAKALIELDHAKNVALTFQYKKNEVSIVMPIHILLQAITQNSKVSSYSFLTIDDRNLIYRYLGREVGKLKLCQIISKVTHKKKDIYVKEEK